MTILNIRELIQLSADKKLNLKDYSTPSKIFEEQESLEGNVFEVSQSNRYQFSNLNLDCKKQIFAYLNASSLIKLSMVDKQNCIDVKQVDWKALYIEISKKLLSLNIHNLRMLIDSNRAIEDPDVRSLRKKLRPLIQDFPNAQRVRECLPEDLWEIFSSNHANRAFGDHEMEECKEYFDYENACRRMMKRVEDATKEVKFIPQFSFENLLLRTERATHKIAVNSTALSGAVMVISSFPLILLSAPAMVFLMGSVSTYEHQSSAEHPLQSHFVKLGCIGIGLASTFWLIPIACTSVLGVICGTSMYLVNGGGASQLLFLRQNILFPGKKLVATKAKDIKVLEEYCDLPGTS